MMYIREIKTLTGTLREVQPCGVLDSNGREYFLLHPTPLEPDWEKEGERRFAVVPRTRIDSLNDVGIYPFARHIVTSNFTIVYAPDMPMIYIVKLDENDLSEREWPHPVQDEDDGFPK